MEKDEGKELSLKYKGDDYERARMEMYLQGYTYLGEEKWESPYTGKVYKYILSGVRVPYVVRIEEVGDDGQRLINTAFCDKEDAIRRYNDEHAHSRMSTVSIEQMRDNLVDMIKEDETVFKCINRINKLKETVEVKSFFEYLKKDELEFDDLLNVYDPKVGNQVFSVISRKMQDGYIKTFKSPNGTLYYIVPAEMSYKGYLDSAISKRKIKSWFGVKFLKDIEK